MKRASLDASRGDQGKLFTSIEPATDLNDVCSDDASGLLLTGHEEPRAHAYYIPALGPAPKWAAFLDNLTVRPCTPALRESAARPVGH